MKAYNKKKRPKHRTKPKYVLKSYFDLIDYVNVLYLTNRTMKKISKSVEIFGERVNYCCDCKTQRFLQ